MAAGDDYRIKAEDVNARARRETSAQTRLELEGLALAYLRLADQADRNAKLAPLTDRSRSAAQRQQQQQQQNQQPPQRIRTAGDDVE